jgi:MoaA/NifB/PqqE/SkfB family radical SAM enzyme
MRSKAVANHLLSNAVYAARATKAWNRPILVFVEVTNRCNLKCIMCGRTHDPRYELKGHTGDVTLEMVQRLDPILPYARTVNLVGVGEPTINRHFLEIVEHVKGFGPYTSTTCNATLLTEEGTRRLVRAKLDQIVFSVDGCTERTFETIRVGASFERVTSNIRRFTQFKHEAGAVKPHVRVEFVLMRENAAELPTLPAFAQNLGADGIIVVPMFEHSGEDFAPIVREQSLKHVPLETGRRYWAEFEAELARTGVVATTSLGAERLAEVFGDAAPETGAGPRDTDGLGARAGEPYCTQPWSVIYLSWKGDVRTCCFTDLAFGSLQEQGIDEIWNGQKYRDFRRQVARGEVHPACSDCVARGANYDVLRLSPGFVARKALEKGLEAVGLRSPEAAR